MAAAAGQDNANRRVLAVLGSAVADAAAMPTHWIYSVARVAEVAATHNGGELAFIPADASGGHHEGVPAYHAHTTLKTGDTTYYTTLGTILARSLVEKGDLDVADFQTKLLASFGPGGDYGGYMPSVVKGVVKNLVEGGGVDKVGPLSGGTGHADSTINGVLVVLAARFSGHADVDAKVEAAVRTLVNSDEAVASSQAVVKAIGAAIAGSNAADALATGFGAGASSSITALVKAAQALDEAGAAAPGSADFAAVAEKFGPACDIANTIPLFVYAARYGGPTGADFLTAVRTTVALSGDNSGRAPLVGALVAASEAPGANVAWLPWLAKVSGLEELTGLAAALAAAGAKSA